MRAGHCLILAWALLASCSARLSPATPEAAVSAVTVATTTAASLPPAPPPPTATPTASTPPPPAAAAAAPDPPSTAPTLTLAARHDGFHDAWVVSDKLVLVGCHRLRLLETDLTKGRDVPAQEVSDKSCNPLVVGVRDNALLLAGSPPRAVDIATGHVGGIAQVDAGVDTDAGAASYNRDGTGVVWLERHPRSGYEVWPLVAGKDSLFSYGPDGLVRATDPATGRVVWEYGTGLEVRGDEDAARPPLLWNMKGEEILVARSRSVHGNDGIILFRHGTAPTPVWTGTVRGHAKGASFSLEGNRVHAAGRSMLLDAKSAYSLPISARGTLLVGADACGAGCDLPTEAVDVEPGHGPYTVDLKVKLFEQGCR